MAEEILQLVDEDDKPIGGASRKEIKTKGLLHRIVRITLEDELGNILLQKRVKTKDTYPGCWDTAAAGHVDVDEDYLTAAKREMGEEIGVKDIELEEILYYRSQTTAPNGMILNRFTKLYRGIIPHDLVLRFQETEVETAAWFSRSELAELVKKSDEVTDGIFQTYERYYKTT